MYNVYGQCKQSTSDSTSSDLMFSSAPTCDITKAGSGTDVPPSEPVRGFSAQPGSDAWNKYWDEITFPTLITDPQATECSAWTPASGAYELGEQAEDSARCQWQVVGQHHPYQCVPWGLVFLGMSMSHNYDENYDGFPNESSYNEASVTHQAKFNIDRVQDRLFQYISGTNDDGWLAGGGESTSSAFSSMRLPAPDTSHIELAHLGALRGTFTDVYKASFVDNLARQNYYGSLGWNVAGIDLSEIIVRTCKTLLFTEKLTVVPTKLNYTPKAEVQLRFNPHNPNVNRSLYEMYKKLIKLFYDVQVLEVGDPFHVSLARDLKFCCPEAKEGYRADVSEKTIRRWAEKGHVVLNDNILRYTQHGAEKKDISGGFYLFLTRKRPLIYFAPRLGQTEPGCDAYFVSWEQDNKYVLFRNDTGGPVEETLWPLDPDNPLSSIPTNVAAPLYQALHFCYHARELPTTPL